MGLPAPVLPDFHVPVQLNSSTVQNYGITLWIYNEIPQKDSLRFEFLDEKGTVQFQFSFHLAATGWRACWIGFKHMQGKKENLSLAQCRITSPATKGKIYLDRMTYPVKKSTTVPHPTNKCRITIH